MDYELLKWNIKHYGEPCSSLYDSLRRSAGRFPDKTAVVDDEGSVSYAELRRRVDLLAAYLQETFHLRAGDQVGIMMVNSIRTVFAFYALAKLRCTAVWINTKYQTDEAAYIFEDTEIRAVLFDSCWWDKIRTLLPGYGIRYAMSEKVLHCAGVTMKTFADAMCSGLPSAPCEAELDDVTALLYTSGTTGHPKGILLSQRNMLDNAYGYEKIQQRSSRDITVLSVPLFHILGLSCVTTYFLYLGATVVLSAFYHPESTMELITRWHATHFHSVPTVYLQMLRAYDPEQYDLSSLEVAVCGGAPVDEAHVEQFCRIAPNASFRRAYGMTETAGAGALSHTHRAPLKAVPNVGIVVVNEQGERAAANENGEIVFFGSVVTPKIWKAPKGTGGVMRSGDIGYENETGEIFVLDRIKDLINRGGEKIFPAGIEQVLLKIDHVAEAAVAGMRSEEFGEVPVAVLVAEQGERIDLDEVRAVLARKVAKFKRPVRIEVWDALPRTANGKVRKAEIQKYFNETS